MQLDIFEDSRDVALRNALADAVSRNDHASAQAGRAALAHEYPDDWALAPAGLLIDALAGESTTPWPQVDVAGAARTHLADQLTPAARRLLGEQPARAWLAQRWGVLAQRAAALPWSPQHPDDHAAPLWLMAGDWAAAAAAVERIPSWRRIPVPLAWMASARWHTHGLDAAWPLLAELAWLAPPRCEALLWAHAHADLEKRLRRFEEDFGDSGPDWAWLPAWIAVDQPALARTLAPAQQGQLTAAERAFRVVLALLRLEREGRQREVVAHRKELRALDETLFGCYMRTR